MKVNLTYQSKGHRELKRYLEAYYDIADPERIDEIKISIFNPSSSLIQRKESYLKHKKTLELLKPLFKKIKKAHIQIAEDLGFDSYLGLKLAGSCAAHKKLGPFFSNVDTVVRQINKHLPIPKNTPDWYWSELNIPDSLYYFKDDFKLHIPKDVYKLLEGYFPKFRILKKKIFIEEVADMNPRAKYNSEGKTVTVEVPHNTSLYNALTLIHELGHAISLLGLADLGIDPYSKNECWHEKEAYKFKFGFEEKAFPKELKYASRGEVLNDLLSTFFEYDIYSNPDQNFDTAYARAINRCYPGKSNQSSNPFYVLENAFILRPFGTLVPSIVQTELLSSKNVQKE